MHRFSKLIDYLRNLFCCDLDSHDGIGILHHAFVPLLAKRLQRGAIIACAVVACVMVAAAFHLAHELLLRCRVCVENIRSDGAHDRPTDIGRHGHKKHVRTELHPFLHVIRSMGVFVERSKERLEGASLLSLLSPGFRASVLL